MKFQFAMKIAGVSKNDAQGNQKIWEGANLDFQCEATVPEMVEVFKDRQLGLDKVIHFVKQDLPNSIKDCGAAILAVERQNRLLNNELPSKSRKELMQQVEELQKWNNELHNDLSQKETEFMDEHLNKIGAREEVDRLKKQLEEKERIINSLRADCEGTSRELEKTRKEYEYLKKQWNEENDDRDNNYTTPYKH